MKPLTERQATALDAIKELYDELNRIPTPSELNKILKVGTSYCGTLIETLERKKYLAWDSWGIKLYVV
jgi:SOS-response transcriptional repressor LexA